MGIFSNDSFKCMRCGRKGEQMQFAPLPNELGARVYNEICQSCWKEWLQKQNQLINHFPGSMFRARTRMIFCSII
ncbi:MAG: Fe(2+)-trafficking protein [Acidobacteria bacterium]|nr:Fe(2+)-trafficking protein [Acidobacteriota bacterium]